MQFMNFLVKIGGIRFGFHHHGETKSNYYDSNHRIKAPLELMLIYSYIGFKTTRVKITITNS